MHISASLWSSDNPKAEKARKYGALNAIMYLAPAEVAGVGNLCPNASEGCKAACLAMYSGQAAMVRNSDDPTVLSNVRTARIAKSRAFMRDRVAFMRAAALQLALQYRRARKAGLELIVRPNGGTDIAFEAVSVDVDAKLAARLSCITGKDIAARRYPSLFALFPFVRFNDYTKTPKRMRRFLAEEMPSNYHLTFSRAENNDAAAYDVIAAGGNVAAVFNRLPNTWGGVRVIDGDAHDLRCTDPRGVVVGLTPKGRKAKRDKSGFIICTL